MTIGLAQTVKDSIKKYGWVFLSTSANVQKSLSVTVKKVVLLHYGTPRGLDSVVAGKSMKSLVGKKTLLSPAIQNNQLFADLVAFKLSIQASLLDKTPVGFGDLILNDTAANPWNGKTLSQLAVKADSMMTGYPGRTFENAGTYAKLASTIRSILNAFEGPIDTASFSGKLALHGAQPLVNCKILKADPNATPSKIIPTSVATVDVPEQYSLYQNYPNPFNPTTTIQFDLPLTSTVTLKVYNILGQEVATLLDHSQMDGGQQSVQFNAGNYASGVYLYRITAQSVNDAGVTNTFSSVKKMILMK